jgi:hypothetical protein
MTTKPRRGFATAAIRPQYLRPLLFIAAACTHRVAIENFELKIDVIPSVP